MRAWAGDQEATCRYEFAMLQTSGLLLDPGKLNETVGSQHDETTEQLVTNSRSWNEDMQATNSKQPRLTGVW